ncbi:hypothetical protein [Longimicrobium sp.]|uniref:hypothetical protein n=1 Tax=Longimicrobium sp. TaxID=2029185 RepID=UPI003B3B54CC
MNPVPFCVLALPLALVACGGGGDRANTGNDTTSVLSLPDSGALPTAPGTEAGADTAMTGATGIGGAVTMNAVGNSGITGQAQFMEHGPGQTMVTITLNGQGDGPRSGHIHQGTCESPGQVVAPLQDVVLANGTGTSTTTVSVGYPAVTNGQHMVAYHTGAGENPGPPAVCGQIPAQQTGGSTGQAM